MDLREIVLDRRHLAAPSYLRTVIGVITPSFGITCPGWDLHPELSLLRGASLLVRLPGQVVGYTSTCPSWDLHPELHALNVAALLVSLPGLTRMLYC